MIELLRRNNVDFDRNAVIALVGWALLSALCVLAIRRLVALETMAQSARRGTWPAAVPLASTRWPQWLAASCLFAVVAALAETIAAARALYPRLPPPPMEPGALASLLARSLSWQLDATAMASLSLPVVLLAGLLAITLAACARQRALGLQTAMRLWYAGDHSAASAWLAHPGPNPLVAIAIPMLPMGLVLLPLWHGVHHFVTSFMIALGRVHDLPDGSNRGALMAEASVGYRASIEPTLALALAGLSIGTVVGLALLVCFDPARRRRAIAPHSASHEPSSLGRWTLTVVLLSTAILIFRHAASLRLENVTPWPKRDPAAITLRLTIETPPLAPNDVAPMAPLLVVDGTKLSLDARDVDLAGLEGDLGTLKRAWSSLHPGERFAGHIIVACSPRSAASQVVGALQAAHRAGYASAWFAFGRTLEHRRPVIGTLPLARTRYARAELLEGSAVRSDTESPPIVPSAYADCTGLSGAIVRARADGKPAQLLLPASQR
jgi:hypothetical protein